MHEEIKHAVLSKNSAGRQWRKAKRHGLAKWFIGGTLIHMRFCSGANTDGVTYAYNINPNTLDAQFEVWIVAACLMRGGKQTVIRLWASQPVASRLLY